MMKTRSVFGVLSWRVFVCKGNGDEGEVFFSVQTGNTDKFVSAAVRLQAGPW